MEAVNLDAPHNPQTIGQFSWQRFCDEFSFDSQRHEIIGAPEEIRTPDPLVRSYPCGTTCPIFQLLAIALADLAIGTAPIREALARAMLGHSISTSERDEMDHAYAREARIRGAAPQLLDALRALAEEYTATLTDMEWEDKPDMHALEAAYALIEDLDK